MKRYWVGAFILLLLSHSAQALRPADAGCQFGEGSYVFNHVNSRVTTPRHATLRRGASISMLAALGFGLLFSYGSIGCKKNHHHRAGLPPVTQGEVYWRLVDGRVGQSYSDFFPIPPFRGAESPYAYTYEEELMSPPGLYIDSERGEIWGMPTNAGSYLFSVIATDKPGDSIRIRADITILP